jgi:hypothetical protein
MDENVEDAITAALRALGIDVLTAQENGHREIPDPIVFDRANGLGRILVSTDTDMLREVSIRLQHNESFTGVVFWKQQKLPIGLIIDDLALLSEAGTLADTQNRVIYLPI